MIINYQNSGNQSSGGGGGLLGGLFGGGGQSGGIGGLLNPLGMLSNPMGMVNMPLGMINNLGLMGGLNGQPGAIEGLFNEDVPQTGINGLLGFFGLNGILPKGMIATGRDGLPIAGQIAGSMFLPMFGGVAGKAAGTMASSMLLGNKGTTGEGYWQSRGYPANNTNNRGLLSGFLGR
ncbi:MAG: hypothetical protein WC356_02710 [Candidatus Micrarchaeia archaeon]|jgi:hypothetical protein